MQAMERAFDVCTEDLFNQTVKLEEMEKYEEQLRNVQKKMQAMESAFDVCTEDLFNQTVKLEEMEKKAGNAEGEVSALRGRLILLQENNEKQEERLAKA